MHQDQKPSFIITLIFTIAKLTVSGFPICIHRSIHVTVFCKLYKSWHILLSSALLSIISLHDNYTIITPTTILNMLLHDRRDEVYLPCTAGLLWSHTPKEVNTRLLQTFYLLKNHNVTFMEKQKSI